MAAPYQPIGLSDLARIDRVLAHAGYRRKPAAPSKPWTGRTINGAISVGSMVYVSREENSCTSTVPNVGDSISLCVNGEKWTYSVVSAADHEVVIHSDNNSLTLIPTSAAHPALDESFHEGDRWSVWVIQSVENR